jgi:cytochrome c-type biogenesis protein CcmF
VRSGILDSIHAFGASTVGGWFLTLIGVVVAGTALLVVSRLGDLRSERRIDSLLSRESFFLLNNLVLVGLCFVVFWGTFFPLISEAVTGRRASVGPPWFDRYTVPLALLLVLLSGIGPLLAWRRVTIAQVRRVFAVPVGVALVTLLALVLFSSAADSTTSLVLFTFGAFTITSVTGEFWRGVRTRRLASSDGSGTALLSIVRRNRRRYGGYIIHAGIAVVLIGVAASSAFSHQVDVRLTPGQTAQVGDYKVRYQRPTSAVSNQKLDFGAVLDVSKGGKHVAVLHPSRSYFPSLDTRMGPIGRFFGGESTSEVGMKAGLRRDIWTAMQPDLSALKPGIRAGNRQLAQAGPDAQAFAIAFLAMQYERKAPAATFRLIVNPMVTWIWLGGMIGLGGALLALWPSPQASRRRLTSLYAARLGRELSRARA